MKENLKSIPKRNHYLPRFYLDFFCQDSKLWVYDKQKSVFQQQTPINTAVEKDLYILTNEDGTKNVEIETKLSEIESGAKIAIQKIDQRKQLSTEDKKFLTLFVSFIKVRVPNFFKELEISEEKFLKDGIKHIYANKKYFEKRITDYEKDTGNKIDVPTNAIFEIIDKGNYHLEFSKKHKLSVMNNFGYEGAEKFLKMQWVFAQAFHNSSVITSDNPFLLTKPINHNSTNYKGIGILTPGAVKIIPLSKKTLMMIGDLGHDIKCLDLSDENIEKFNINIALNSYRFIYSDRDELLKRVVDRMKEELKKK